MSGAGIVCSEGPKDHCPRIADYLFSCRISCIQIPGSCTSTQVVPSGDLLLSIIVITPSTKGLLLDISVSSPSS